MANSWMYLHADMNESSVVFIYFCCVGGIRVFNVIFIKFKLHYI